MFIDVVKRSNGQTLFVKQLKFAYQEIFEFLVSHKNCYLRMPGNVSAVYRNFEISYNSKTI